MRLMGRYKSPTPPSSKYITPEGAIALEKELEHLWRRKRPAVTRAVRGSFRKRRLYLWKTATW